jgi:SAM-dependent methyltransferase
VNALAPQVEPYASIAPVYDHLIGDAGLEPIWLGFLRSCRHYDIRFASAADVGCGTGRFLQRLAAVGQSRWRLYGVDRSGPMLAIAQRRLADTTVRLLRQGMSQLALPERVDLVTANFAVLNYQRELIALRVTLEKFNDCLTLNGYLVFDVLLSGAGVLPELRQFIRLPGIEAQWDILPSAGERGAMVRMETCFDHGDQWTCAREVHVQRWWSLTALKSVLPATGFLLLGLHRLGDHGPAARGDRWVQVVARRL